MSFVHLENNGLVIEADTAPLLAVGGPVASVLIIGSGPSGSTNIVDSSANAFPVVVSGNTAISTAQAPTGMDSSIFFDGSGDLLGVTGGTAVSFDTGPYTLEAWIYVTSFSGTEDAVFRFDQGTRFSTFSMLNRRLFLYDTLRGTICTGATTIQTNTWYHIACCRAGTGTNQTRLFLNGVQDAQGTQDTSLNAARLEINNAAVYPWPGYISNVRVVKGVALYTSNFTVPTPPLTTGMSLIKYGVIQNY